eukprot:s573_g14.t1
MPEPTAEELAEASAKMAAEFETQAADMRQYWEQSLGRDLREKLLALAERRPSDPTKLLGQALAGKKSVGEMASAPQTSDPALKSAPPREFLNNTVVPQLASALVEVNNKGSRRVVSDLGEILMKQSLTQIKQLIAIRTRSPQAGAPGAWDTPADGSLPEEALRQNFPGNSAVELTRLPGSHHRGDREATMFFAWPRAFATKAVMRAGVLLALVHRFVGPAFLVPLDSKQIRLPLVEEKNRSTTARTDAGFEPARGGSTADISDASAQRQKLVVFREQWKAKVLAKPEDAAAFARLGEVCAQLDEVDGLFRFGQQLFAQHAEAWRPAAATLKVLAPDRAEELTDLLLGVLHLPNVDSRGRAEACSQLGQLRPQEAEKWYRQALAWDPDSFAALRLAETLGESGRLAEAAEMFQVAGIKHELKPCHLFQYGEALVLSERFDSGRALLRKAAEADLSLAAMAHACMALSYLLQQQIGLAMDCCHQALERTTGANTEAVHLARFLKSFCYLRNFDLEAAVEAVSETLQTCGGDNPLRESMEAFKVRLQAMQPKPGHAHVIQMGDNFDTQTAAAFLHLTLGQWDDAEEVLQNVLQGDGCCPEALIMQAQLLLRA